MAGLDTAVQIRQLREQLQQRLSDLEEQLRPLQSEAAKIRAQLDLATKLFEVANRDVLPSNAELVGAEPQTGPKQPIGNVVAEILEASASPLHISEIRNRYVATGREIPGKGAEANLLAYMVRDPRFVRVAKGTYALVDPNSPVKGIQLPTVNTRRKRPARP